MRAVAANRHELWVSVAVASLGLFFASVPVTFNSALLLSGVMLVAFFCALNAVLDLDEMSVGQTYLAVLWFVGLAIMTPLTLYWMASIHEFANK
jgi:hypothetical protein